jgi:hypothetical protein
MLLGARGVLYRLSLEEWVQGIGRLGSARHCRDERTFARHSVSPFNPISEPRSISANAPFRANEFSFQLSFF